MRLRAISSNEPAQMSNRAAFELSPSSALRARLVRLAAPVARSSSRRDARTESDFNALLRHLNHTQVKSLAPHYCRSSPSESHSERRPKGERKCQESKIEAKIKGAHAALTVLSALFMDLFKKIIVF